MANLTGPTLSMIENPWVGSLENAYGASRHSSYLEERFEAIFIKSRSEPECAICYEGYLENKQVILLSCGHLFHEACYKMWQPYKFEDNPCPYCMQVIKPAVILSDKGEQYSCSLNGLRRANSVFSRVEWLIEDLIRLKKRLEKTGESNFDPLIRSFFELLKTYHSLKTTVYSNPQINTLVQRHIQDLFHVFFSLDLTVRLRLFDLVTDNLDASIFESGISFKLSLERIGYQFFSESKEAQSYFISKFCNLLVSFYSDIKKQRKGDFAYLKGRIVDRAFRTHLTNLETRDPTKQYAYLEKIPRKYFLDFQKRIEKMEGIPNKILSDTRKIQQIRNAQTIALFSFAVLGIVAFGVFIFRNSFSKKEFLPNF